MHWDNGLGGDLAVQGRLAALRAMIEPAVAPEALPIAAKGILEVRHPVEGEILPFELQIPLPRRNNEWVWVIYSASQPQAALYAADFHGVVFLNALKALKGTQMGVLTRLLRATARECRERSYDLFMSFFDVNKAPELQMMRMMQRLGAGFIPASGAWGVAHIPKHKGWK